MKKVSNVTLGSIVFAIEEDAYEMLEIYLREIKVRLSSADDQVEIMTDIESAMAEKLISSGKSEKIAVTLFDIERLQGEMGAPAAFGEQGDVTDAAPTEKTSETKKRLFRDTEDSIIAGVSSGLARYFDVDPVIVRIAFAVGAFLNGIGVIAYIILWIAVPKAETTAEKFAMRGQRVTLQDISDRVKKT